MTKYVVGGLVAGALFFSSIYGIFAAGVAAREARWNREVLCIGILHNENNTARIDARVVDLCAKAGITHETP